MSCDSKVWSSVLGFYHNTASIIHIKQPPSVFYTHLTNLCTYTRLLSQKDLQYTVKINDLRVRIQPMSRMTLGKLWASNRKENRPLKPFQGKECSLSKEQSHGHQTSLNSTKCRPRPRRMSLGETSSRPHETLHTCAWAIMV